MNPVVNFNVVSNIIALSEVASISFYCSYESISFSTNVPGRPTIMKVTNKLFYHRYQEGNQEQENNG